MTFHDKWNQKRITSLHNMAFVIPMWQMRGAFFLGPFIKLSYKSDSKVNILTLIKHKDGCLPSRACVGPPVQTQDD